MIFTCKARSSNLYLHALDEKGKLFSLRCVLWMGFWNNFKLKHDKIDHHISKATLIYDFQNKLVAH